MTTLLLRTASIDIMANERYVYLIIRKHPFTFANYILTGDDDDIVRTTVLLVMASDNTIRHIRERFGVRRRIRRGVGHARFAAPRAWHG
jgi:hypothetical protein